MPLFSQISRNQQILSHFFLFFVHHQTFWAVSIQTKTGLDQGLTIGTKDQLLDFNDKSHFSRGLQRKTLRKDMRYF